MSPARSGNSDSPEASASGRVLRSSTELAKQLFCGASESIAAGAPCPPQCLMVLSAAAYRAAIDGDFQGVVVALDTGTNVNDRTASEDLGGSDTMLMAATHFNHYKLMRFLLERGADPNISDNEQMDNRPLRLAGDERAIDLLVAYGADVNYASRTNVEFEDGLGKTALMSQAEMNRLGCVRALLRHGASCSLRNSDGRTALEHAQWSLDNLDPFPIQRKKFQEVVDLLTAVEASGSWKAYVREPVVQLLSLRYLCLAGRATAPPHLARCFGSPPIASADKAQTPLPDEVFEHILTFWNFAGT